MLNAYKVLRLTIGEGDLLNLTLDLFFDELYRVQRVKLMRLEAPQDKDARTKYEEYIIKKTSEAKEVKAVLYPSGKNSNVFLADIIYDGNSLNKELMSTGIAKGFKRRVGKPNGQNRR